MESSKQILKNSALGEAQSSLVRALIVDKFLSPRPRKSKNID